LGRLLETLQQQNTGGMFSYSLIITDNDASQSAKPVVDAFSALSSIPAIYCVEPEQNIALARNKAIAQSSGDFIAFIDDDEIPENSWLIELLRTCLSHHAAGVLGPVKPFFEHKPASWIIDGHFFERPRHKTGFKIGASDARTGNVLLRREILDGLKDVFRPQFSSGGEDVDFFKRMAEKKLLFVWCDEAVVHELVPPERCKYSYLLRAALLRGNNNNKSKNNKILLLLKSVIAIPSYLILLPFLAISSRSGFIKFSIKLFDHTGRILAFLGLNPVHTRYVTKKNGRSPEIQVEVIKHDNFSKP